MTINDEFSGFTLVLMWWLSETLRKHTQHNHHSKFTVCMTKYVCFFEVKGKRSQSFYVNVVNGSIFLLVFPPLMSPDSSLSGLVNSPWGLLWFEL